MSYPFAPGAIETHRRRWPGLACTEAIARAVAVAAVLAALVALVGVAAGQIDLAVIAGVR